MYKIGTVYIWQHQVGMYAFLNGTETTVLEGPDHFINTVTGLSTLGWITDSEVPEAMKRIGHDIMIAYPGDLRLKEPPNGERSILELFEKQPEPEVV